MRKEQFKRPEPGFSLYEGRTRGKRMKYTYSDDEDFFTDSTGPRRSTRNTGTSTPAEALGPLITASGRHIRAPNRLNAETVSNSGLSAAPSVPEDASFLDVEMEEASLGPTGRPRRSAAVHHSMNGWASKVPQKKVEYDSEEDEDSEPDFGDDEEDEHVPDEEDEEEEEEFNDDDEMLDLEEGEVDLDASLLFTFPIRVTYDKETGKMVKMPSKRAVNKALASYAEDSDSAETGSAVSRPSRSRSKEETLSESPVPTADEISVAVKARVVTPESAVEAVDIKQPDQRPLTPSSGVATSLAFRGSPEKPQHVALPIDVGGGE